MTQLAAPTTQSTTVDPLPSAIDSASAKLVYLYLDTVGPTTITELSAALDMRMLGLYSVLDTLASDGLVDSEGETYFLA
ncbi:TrmB family transcriptional regulator [Salinigranum marinum]|uniref:TrmB family transcriptional regulator n=1 Tax=Salinigranum marinum TaxID=1515595 RepID=UPI00298A02A4|nr:TrmB family transcriptional regulator [Salinigranum marinum]